MAVAVAPISIPAPDHVRVKRALISVSDKTGLADFAKALAARGVELVSTGGTKAMLAGEGLAIRDVVELTGFPEIMDGRVKTLHPGIHGGLLAVRDHPDHAKAMTEHNIVAIDLVIVTLYPFEDVLASGAKPEAIIENIDIGGPAMVRASAKNHAYVTIVTDPTDYSAVLAELDQNAGQTSLAFRKSLAAKAFARTAAYDAAVAGWFADTIEEAPRHRAFAGKLSQELRYGENPHQKAALYLTGEKRPGVARAHQLQGKELSWNNINDTDAAFELVAEFNPAESAACAIIKHCNPCGVAAGASLTEAYKAALSCDTTSAFGGIVAVNQTLDAEAASEIIKVFTEVIIAPAVTDEAAAIIATKKNLRLLVTDGLPDARSPGLSVKSIAGGLLVQSRDNGVVGDLDLKLVTKRSPSAQELSDLRFAFRVAKHVKSNAIVYAKNGATVGIGAGQMSRLDSARIAVVKAKDAAAIEGWSPSGAHSIPPKLQGCVVASDAFFPFADGLITAIEAGATAVIQPGGSMRDDEVIAAADERGVAMVFTGMRHFRH
jgi:phosphoribosylaminoimidazolecarboxamide formyltransferase / IMP cyclohydrolase